MEPNAVDSDPEGLERLFDCRLYLGLTCHSSPVTFPDRIVMSPMRKEKDYTLLRMERVKANKVENSCGDKHIAGGTHVGLVVNKQMDDSSNQ